MGFWWITPNLCLGDKAGASNIPNLRQAGVTHVVNVAGSKYDNLAARDGIQYLNVRLLDKETERLPLEEVLSFTGSALNCRGEVNSDLEIGDETDHVNSQQNTTTTTTTTTTRSSSNIKSINVVLIHCRGGLSRSVSLVVAHLMMFDSMSLDDAIKTLKNVRGRHYVNRGFMKQLKEFEKSLMTT
mmetsp:Transcript_28464/g.69256  ORF Transcript_28464/g.69256 Transcript_28464/m.69256 type:complete len:185 (-) Transcript_28464:3962-4516(-)